MKDHILAILGRTATLSISEIADRVNSDPESVRIAINELIADRKIVGYKAIIDEDVMSDTKVKALIEVKVTPQRDGGFDKIARRIAGFNEVTDLFLVSGNFDLLVILYGESLREVGLFVSEKLATIEGVLSTSTTFQLKKYKESGRLLDNPVDHQRLQVCP